MATSTLGSGTLVLAGTTSGTTTVTATAVAGTTTLTLPAATDTLVGKATTDTLTNKTLTGAAMNGTLGATTPSTASVTTLTTSSTITHNGGTANGVGYLNGSKVLTTGSALVFDGSNLGVNQTSPSFKIDAIGSTTNGSGIVTTLRLKNGGTTQNDGAKILFTAGNSTDGAGIGSGGQSPDSGDLRFFTGGNTETVRINSSGQLCVGATVTAATAKVGITTTATSVALGMYTTGTGGTSGYIIRSGDDSLFRFQVFTNGDVQNTNNSYGAISDAKLKENIVDASPKLADLMQVKVRNYNLKADPNQKQIGVIAQELEAVFPSMINESQDTDKEGNDLGTTSKSVKYSVFVPMLIKAMQEQQALITQLQADVLALKGA